MRFKTLEIQGFKSFPDKTVLTFDSRTTAVVGSNGNGKSNISDALRWVMGEQGAKTLRGDKMEDVIFHGTLTRKPLGFAKVTLTIDNSDGGIRVGSVLGLEVDLEQSEQNSVQEQDNDVVITRKLYRTGDSEYLINGKKSRLKDIHTLFMGTGLGRDGYSIIGQGRIDEIVNSKATNRREIFEEAAGVSKFLFKKAGAQRELDRTDENLLRLLDIENELKERLPKLEKQAEKANKAFALKEEERALGVAVSVRELTRISKDIQENENTILLNQGECEHYEREIEEYEKEADSILLTKQELNAKIDRLRREGEVSREKIANTDKEIAVMQSEISHNNGRISGIREQFALSEKGDDELSLQIEDLRKQIVDIECEIVKIESSRHSEQEALEKLEEQSSSLDGENSELSQKIVELYAKKSAAEIFISRSGESIAELENQIIQAKELISGQAKEKARLVSSKNALNSELDVLIEERDETANKLSGYSKLYEGKASKLDVARERLDKLKIDEQQCKTRLEILSDVERSMSGYYHSVKTVMQATKSGRFTTNDVLGTVADVITVESRFGTAVEIALGSALQNIIVANESVAKRCISFLKENKAGRATFLPLTSVQGRVLENHALYSEDGFIGLGHEIVGCDEKFSSVIRSLLGRTAFAEDIDSATIIAKKHGYKFRIVTLDGQVINAGGSFTGGSVKKSEGIISRKQELEGLQKRTAKLQSELLPAKESHDLLAAECAKMKLECEGFRENLSRFSGEEMRLTAELNGVGEMLKQFNERLDQSEETLESCEDKIAEEKTACDKNQNDLVQIVQELSQREVEASNKGSLLESIVENRRKISECISDLNMQKLTKQKDIENYNSQIVHFENTRSQSDANRVSLLDEIAELEAKNKELENEIVTKKEKISQTDSGLFENKSEIAELTKLNEEHEKRSVQIHSEIREKISHKEKFSNALATAIERKTSLEKKAEEIKASLFDDYELTPTEAVEFSGKVASGTDGFAACGGLMVESTTEAADRNVIKQAKAALGEIRKQLAALGDVNYAAITEFSEVSARYKDLSEQLSDIRKAKRELEKLIDELQNEIRTRFLASFNEISVHFSRIFTEIFGGGTARLELVNTSNHENYEEAEDVLAAGVEIFAAPPGKLSKSLMALSGGEKALVAITLYLAILLHRPTPFCMLDEVDAALDEVNVVKYINYLKRYADTTQLMMITHRRSTIEGCDVLYGVFMQEKGVSRLLKQEIYEINEN
ncbi:MAG: chromosome segregation protein SMC [Oscillospiraceae bacterium]|nr:chromosome segregation protein SMC [Oscillospiraceae bacterium]